jgi:membrane-associated phospholipid phosphatase
MKGWWYGRPQPCLLTLLIIGASAMSVQAQPTMNLGYLTRTSNFKVQSLEFPHTDAGKTFYNLTILSAGALVASDDRGLDKTIVGTTTPGIKHAADAFNDLGNLTYVAPALGLVYLTGGHTNEDLAWKASIAVMKAGAVGLLVKDIAGRERPNGPDDKADDFKPFSTSDTFSSFPSGHTLVAFSVATVWADEKPKERFAAYGLASLVGLARIYSNAHWPSDVFFGAILGVSQGREAFRGDTNLLLLRF